MIMLRSLHGALAAVFLGAVLTACGGGGGGGGGGGVAFTPTEGKNPESLVQQNTFNDDDIRHFLMRTHFGVKQSEFDAVKAIGLPAYIDQMLARPMDPGFETLALDTIIPDAADRLTPSREQLERLWLWIMMNTTDPFREVLAMFWHDHFATGTSVLDSDERRWYFDHLRLLRTGGYGNFRQFLFDISTDWTVLEWLDGNDSRVNNINENFAREFWELFTLGEGNGYTQADIEEAARCFTGYDDFDNDTTNLRETAYDETRHDEGDKLIFGITIQGRSGPDAWREYQDVIDLTLDNRPVAEFIVNKLWEYFVYEAPSATLLQELSTIFRNSNYELRPLMAAMFKSEAFYSNRARTGIMKSPVDYGIGFVRTTGLQIEPSRLEDGLTASGQRPTRPPNVAGWEQGDLWLSAQNAVERANLIQDTIGRRSYQNGLGIDIRDVFPAPADPVVGLTAEEIVDHAARALRASPTPEERDRFITYLNTVRQSDGSIVDDPFDPSSDSHFDQRVRGLFYILSQHPSYHVR